MLSYLSSTTKATGRRSVYELSRRTLASLPEWATIDPKRLGSTAEPYAVQNLVDGQWKSSKQTMKIIHPLDKDAHPIFTIPDTQSDEIEPFIESLRKVPKTGVHNPLKNPERYLQFGEISRKVQ